MLSELIVLIFRPFHIKWIQQVQSRSPIHLQPQIRIVPFTGPTKFHIRSQKDQSPFLYRQIVFLTDCQSDKNRSSEFNGPKNSGPNVVSYRLLSAW